MTYINMLLFLIAWIPVEGQVSRALTEQALGETTRITLEKVKLVDALPIITAQTGVKITMTPDVVDLVPDGRNLVIDKVEIAGIPLGQGLENLFGPLGMRFEVADDGIRVVPKDAIVCLGRAPTWGELDVLKWVTGLRPGVEPASLDALEKRTQFQGGPQLSWGALRSAIQNVGAGPGDEVLSIACGQLGWAWCISGDMVLVTPVEWVIRQRLQTPVTLRMNNRPLGEVLSAIGEQLGIRVSAEPGALASLPQAMQQNFSVNSAMLSAEKVLERIANTTGLGYLIGADGVVFYQSESRAMQGREGGGSGDPYVAKCAVEVAPGKTIEWLIRASELPEDLREMRQHDLNELFEAARRRGERVP